jgi:hypothetical protein
LGTNLLLGHPPLVLRRAIQEPFDRARQSKFFRELRRVLEVGAKALRFGQVIVAQAALDLELGVFFGEAAQPFFDLAAAILVAGSGFSDR